MSAAQGPQLPLPEAEVDIGPPLPHTSHVFLSGLKGKTYVCHSKTLERQVLPSGTWQLHFHSSGAAFLNDGSGGAQWVKDFLRLSLHRDANGDLVIYDKSTGRRRPAIATTKYRARYPPLMLELGRCMAVKVYQFQVATDGAYLFWEARVIQHALHFSSPSAKSWKWLADRWRWWLKHIEKFGLKTCHMYKPGDPDQSHGEEHGGMVMPFSAFSAYALVALLAGWATRANDEQLQTSAANLLDVLVTKFLQSECSVSIALAGCRMQPGQLPAGEVTIDLELIKTELHISELLEDQGALEELRSLVVMCWPAYLSSGRCPVHILLKASYSLGKKLIWLAAQLCFIIAFAIESSFSTTCTEDRPDYVADMLPKGLRLDPDLFKLQLTKDWRHKHLVTKLWGLSKIHRFLMSYLFAARRFFHGQRSCCLATDGGRVGLRDTLAGVLYSGIGSTGLAMWTPPQALQNSLVVV